MKSRKYEKLVISICMLIVVSFALVTATYAWYAGGAPTILEALNLTMDDKGDLKAEIVLESGERMDMSQVDESGASIDLALSKLINIEENKLGPGAFGEVHIFVSSNSATYTSYNIKIIPNCDLIENGDEDALMLAKEHIRFYMKKTENGYEELIPYSETLPAQNVLQDSENQEDSENQDNSESSVDTNEQNVPIVVAEVVETAITEETSEVSEVVETVETSETSEAVETVTASEKPVVAIEGITGEIASGEEIEVVLYWYWPYEYDDVPDKTQISATGEREYDLQDTVIGNYIQSIGFTFVVEGNTDEE